MSTAGVCRGRVSRESQLVLRVGGSPVVVPFPGVSLRLSVVESGEYCPRGVKRLSRSLSLDMGLQSSWKTLGFCEQRSSESIQVELIVKAHGRTARTMAMAGEGLEWEMGSS